MIPKRLAVMTSTLALLVAAPLSLSRAGETTGVDIASADLNGDNVVNAADRDILFADWGSTSSPNDIFLGTPANGPTSNGVVDVDDLNIIQQFFGQTVTAGQTDFSILGADFGDTVIAPGLIKGSPVVTDATNGFYVDPLASVFGSGFYAPLNSAIQTFPSIEFTSYLNFDTGPSTAAFTANGPDFSTPGFGVNDGHFETFAVASGAWYTDTPENSSNVAGVGEAVHVARMSIDRGANLNTQNAQLRVLVDLGGVNIQTVLMPLNGGPAFFDEFGANLPLPIEAVSFLTAQPDNVNGIDLDVYDIYVRVGEFTLVDAGGGGDFNDIQPAIMAASPGDTIVVNPGNYSPIDFLGKPITVRSSDPFDPFVVENTIIDAFSKESCVVFQSGEGNDAVLDGFTITNGSSTNGGGIFVDGAGPTIRNCVIDTNDASAGGGGIYLTDAFLTTIEHCTFDTNTSSAGGAIMVTNFSDDVLIFECDFINNSVVGGPEAGGAIFIESGQATIIDSCSFTLNSAPLGGAIHVNNGPATALALVENCVFSLNSAGSGGAIWSTGTDFDCVSSSFVSNTATDIGGGVALQNSSRAINCIFDDNSATNQGGGAYLFSDFSEVTNCTIVNNSASDGGGVFHADADAIISNSIIVGNTPDQIDQATISINVNFNIVEGGFSGVGNIDADPLFVDETNGNFRLMSGSPAIDAASNNLFPAGLTMDFDGEPRFVDDPNVADTGQGTPPIIDMGAFESQGAMFFTVDDDGPADFSTIQAAIDAAMSGAVIQVNDGTYTEVINFDGKDVAVESVNGPGVTIIDGNMMGSVVVFDSGETDASLDGFTITNGSSSSGGGVFISGSSPAIRNCNITTNTAGLRGAGVYIEAGADVLIANSSISANDAGPTGQSGGIHVEGGSTLTLDDSTIIGNNAERGGGLQCVGAGSVVNATACVFRDNTCDNLGAATNHGNSTGNYTQCIFENNTATNGGGAFNYFRSDGLIVNCLAFDNSGAAGGAIRVIDASNVTIVNSTFTENSGTSGGGLHLDVDADAIVSNCIFWNNGTEIVVNDVDSTAAVTFSNVQGGFAGAGNISVDPLFTDASADDFTVAPFSPAIDAGDNTSVPGGITTDLGGSPRFFDVTQIDDTGNGAAPIVDMGAYESQGPATFLVDQGGGGDFTTIEAAVAAAPTGAIININPGTYTPPSQINFGQNNYQLIGVGPGVIVDMNDNGRHFLMQDGQTNATVIEGITLRNGEASDGGSVFILDGSPIFRDVTFENNEATGGSVGSGGAVNIAGAGSSPVFDDCDFISNVALTQGGAIRSSGGTILVMGGVAQLNTAVGQSTGQGGAFYFSGLSSAIVSQVTFDGNASMLNGGAYYATTTTGSIAACSFLSNEGGQFGGGIGLQSSTIDVTGSVFNGNTANTGGGMVSSGGSPTLQDCVFIANAATSRGGGLFVEGAMAEIIGSLYASNTASTAGGAISNSTGSTMSIINTTISDNSAGSSGGIENSASTLTVNSTIVSGNSPDQIGGTATVQFSIVEGGFSGAGNIDADPLFVDPDGADDTLGTDDDNYRLANGSPAIDAGNNTPALGIATDLDGNLRFVDDTGTPDTGAGVAPIIDIGAYEFQGMSFVDCDGDGVDDNVDLSMPNVQDGVFPLELSENTTGEADATFLGAPDDVFFGLGNGQVTYELNGFRLIDGAGPDLNVYERDNAELEFQFVSVSVSLDGMNFVTITGTAGPAVPVPGDGAHSNPTFRMSYDLSGSGLAEARFIRIQGTDANPPGGSNGFDFDAIGLVNTRALDANTNGVIDDCEITTVFVDSAADGTEDGLSWDNAFTSLDAALDLIANDPEASGADVFVAQGTYVPPAVVVEQGDFATNAATFSIPDGANLIGGFSGDGTETDPSQADPESNLTILSGDANGDDGPNFTNRADNSFHVLTVEPGATVTISGFIIRGGNAAGVGDDADGGGLRMTTGLLTVSDCVFEDNQASGDGGAVALGQIDVLLGDRGISQLFENCTFDSNLATNSGGAICADGVDVVLDTCLFGTNSSVSGSGGAVSFMDGTLFVDDSTFDTNSAGIFGGGLHAFNASVNVFNSDFLLNNADLGGAIFSERSDLTVDLAEFTNNNASSVGGGICFLPQDEILDLRNSSLIGNASDGDGGAIYYEDSDGEEIAEAGGDRGSAMLTVIQCVFAGNNVTGGGDGAAIYSDNVFSDASIQFSSFADNSGSSNTVYTDGDLFITNSILYDNNTTQDITTFGSVSDFNYSIIEAFLTSGDFRGTFENVFSVDPLFVDVQDGNLQLRPGSPAIDAGNTQAGDIPGSDLLGNPRVVDDTGTPDTGIPADGESGPVVDMGAFEFQGTTMQPDFFPFGEPISFSTTEPVVDLDLADLDGDGDLDVIATISDKSDLLVWYEATRGDFDSATQRTIDFPFSTPIAQDTGDVDNDGDLDIVLLTTDGLTAYSSNGAETPSFGDFSIFSIDNARSLDTGDIDNDGDLDVLVGLNTANSMRWYENTAGNGTSEFADRSVLSSTHDFQSVALADMDRDGDLDAVGADNGGVITLARNEMNGSSFVGFNIVSGFAEIVGLAIADVNGDGAPDVIFGAAEIVAGLNGANIDTVQVAINNGTGTSFSTMTAADNIGGVKGLDVADVDHDGDVDILVATGGGAAEWLENDGNAGFTRRMAFDDPDDRSVRHIVAGDTTLTGRDSLVISSDNEFFGNDFRHVPNQLIRSDSDYPNGRVIEREGNGITTIASADLDGDGDLDLVTGSFFDDEIIWYENPGDTTFPWPFHVLTDFNGSTTSDGPTRVHTADVDGDGDPDIVTTSILESSVVVWFNEIGENLGNPLAFDAAVVTTNLAGAYDVDTGDFDGNGTTDLVFAGATANRIDLALNNGFGPVTGGSLIGVTVSSVATGVRSAVPSDVDRDGDLDIFAALTGAGRVVWYENTTGDGLTWDENLISDFSAAPTDIAAVDFDNDGDMDIAVVDATEDALFVYENASGGTSWPRTTVATDLNGATAVSTGDYNRDGFPDIAVASRFENSVRYFLSDAGVNRGIATSFVEADDSPISTNAMSVQSLGSADIDGDGRTDIFAGTFAGDEAVLYRNLGGQYTSTISTDLDGPVFEGDDVQALDINVTNLAPFGDPSVAFSELRVQFLTGLGAPMDASMAASNFDRITITTLNIGNRGIPELVGELTDFGGISNGVISLPLDGSSATFVDPNETQTFTVTLEIGSNAAATVPNGFEIVISPSTGVIGSHAPAPANLLTQQNAPSFSTGAISIQQESVDPCLADCDSSGVVDFNDMICILFLFGNDDGVGDLDGSGVVDFNDLILVLFSFGPCQN